MSVSKWRYTEECDGDYCPGDCDLCDKEPEESEEQMSKDRMLDELSVLQERFASGMGWRDGEYAEALDEAIELINNMPSADVVEVVRCKDCIYHGKRNDKECCTRLEIAFPIMYGDDFCSYGERKETE